MPALLCWMELVVSWLLSTVVTSLLRFYLDSRALPASKECEKSRATSTRKQKSTNKGKVRDHTSVLLFELFRCGCIAPGS